jgi:hypothetical protein
MNATSAHPLTLTLTGEERNELLSLLEQTLRETRVEEHRTDSLNYRQAVGRREALLEALAERVRRLA